MPKNEKNNLENKLTNLPQLPGVYIFKNSENNILYVGKAINLKKRVQQYFSISKNHSPKVIVMVKQISDLEIITTKNEIEALILESNLIKEYEPRYNVTLKDGKSYPYIVITNEPYPRVFVTRRIFNDGSKYFGPYTDLFALRNALKTVKDIFKIRSCNYFIDQKSIEQKKVKICLDYHIKKCDGPCEGLISFSKYNEMIENVSKVLKGKISFVRNTLEDEMKSFAVEKKFEDAAIIRDKIRDLDVYVNKQKILDVEKIDRDVFSFYKEENYACIVVFNIREGKLIAKKHFNLGNILSSKDSEILEMILMNYYSSGIEIPNEIYIPIEIESKVSLQEYLIEKKKTNVKIQIPKIGDKTLLLKLAEQNAKLLLKEFLISKIKKKEIIPHVLKSIVRDLRLKITPRRIECFDISHIQGSETVASMVQFVDAKPKKSEYRRYKIESLEPYEVDDFKSMKEVVLRRYNRLLQEESLLPDLIIIDGGKGQLSSALESLEKLNLKIPIISLAKRLEEVFLPNEPEPLQIPKTSSTLRLFQQIRDEAHRFAVTYHTLLRSKRTLQTELDLIKGVGKKRAKELLESFGSVQGVKFASQEQLTEVVGEKISEKILEYFKKD